MNVSPYRPKLPATYERRTQATDRARTDQTLAIFVMRLALAVAVGGFAAWAIAHSFNTISAAFVIAAG